MPLHRPFPDAWFGAGWRFRLLPHYLWGRDGLETLGGRPVGLDDHERALAQFCVGDGWAPGGGCGNEPRILRSLLARRLLIPVPPRGAVADGPVDLVLSPHVDDAALSLGATIAGAGQPMMVLNIFSRQSYQTGLRVPSDRIDRLAAEEDLLAGEILGYSSLFAGLTGAQDRHGLPLSAVIGCNPADPATRVRLFRDGAMLDAALADLLDRIKAGTRLGRLLVPSAIGGHLDHLLIRQQAPAIAEKLSVTQDRIFLYRDQPYAAHARIPPPSCRPCLVDEHCRVRKHAALLAFATRLRQADIELTVAETAGSGEPLSSMPFSGRIAGEAAGMPFEVGRPGPH